MVSSEMVLPIPFLFIYPCWYLVRLFHHSLLSSCRQILFFSSSWGIWHANSLTFGEYSIIGSLAGCSYWGPVAGHGLLSHDLDLLREERKKYMPEQQGIIPGSIEAVPASEDADHYTIIHKRQVGQENKQSS